MKFKFKIERENATGVKEVSTQEFDLEAVRIGRGPAADIQLESSAVSLAHAVIRTIDGRLVIEDLGSTAGVQVNRELTRSSGLKADDTIKLGDIVLTVINEDGVWGLLREMRGGDAVSLDDEELLAANVAGLDIKNRLPSLLVLSLLVSAALAVYYFILPMAGGSSMSWSSGPLAPQHKMIEADCTACHDSAFEQVRDEKCMACHNVSDHAASLKKVTAEHPKLNFRCAECHMDHNGPHGLIAREPKLCVQCHGTINELVKDTRHPRITDFASHPEFMVSIRNTPGREEFTRVKLGDAALKDPTPIKLNHAVHLGKDIRGPNGPVTMQCRDCHAFSKDMKTIEPISFDRNCRSCHTLEFDEKLPGSQVPHGDTDEVINYVFAEYAKALLQLEQKEKASGRLRPGDPLPTKEQVDLARSKVQQQSRAAEDLLFTRTACQLCHQISEKPEVVEGKSRYDIVKPQIPEHWLPASTFDHGAHQQVACDSCHKGVRDSKETGDVLIPKIKECRECHAEGHVTGKVDSSCIECHSYHDPLEFEDSKRRKILDIVGKMR